MTFLEAMKLIMDDDNELVFRENWDGRKMGEMMGVKVQRPDVASANTEPYIYMFVVSPRYAKGYKREPWVPSMSDFFAADWQRVEVR